MKKLITVIFVLFSSLFVTAQINHDQELINLVVENKWFEANDYYNFYQDSLKYEPIKLAYKGGTAKAFNRTEEAILYFNQGIVHASEMPSLLLINQFYIPLYNCYAEIQDYNKAVEIIEKIISLLDSMKSSENENYLLEAIRKFEIDRRMYETYSHYPPIRKVYNGKHQTEMSFNDSIHNLLTTNAICNGSPLKIMFDTGFTECSMSYDVAKKLNVKIISQDSLLLNSKIGGVMGIIDSLELGTLKIYNIPVFVSSKWKDSFEITDNTKDEKVAKLTKKIEDFNTIDFVVGLPILKLLCNMEWNYETMKLVFYDESKSLYASNLCLFDKGLYLKFQVNRDAYNYMALFDTGGAHGLIINREFYNKNTDLFITSVPVNMLRKRTTLTPGITMNYLYLQPEKFDLQIGSRTIPLLNDCMINETEYPALNLEGQSTEKLAIGINTFKGYKNITVDFNNMYIHVE